MYEIFGIQLDTKGYIIAFFICQLINVALNTIKTIIMHKEEKISSSIINALTYGFYAIIVVMTASALPLWITIVITVVTNLIGVYASMLILEKLKKDSLWEIVATVDGNAKIRQLTTALGNELIPFNMVSTYNGGEMIFHIYSENQKDSKYIKQELDKVNAKYIVHEERMKL